MQASDVMTRTVLTVTPETGIEEMARLLIEHRVSGLPVVDDKGALAGIVTEGDLLRRVETGTQKQHAGWYQFVFGPGRLAAEYTRSHARKVSEIMTSEVVTAAPETPLAQIVKLMEARHIKRVPVVDRGRLVGIVSRANLVAALADVLAQVHGHTMTDDEIRQAMLAEIDKQPWGPRGSVDVTVKEGVVELHGSILDERERSAIVVAAESLPGVKTVRDRLVWVEPNTGVVIPH